MMYIKNLDKLLENTRCSKCRKAREIVLRTLNKALEEANPQKAVRKSLKKMRRGVIEVCGKLFSYRKLYVIGFGKASGEMALAIEEIIGEDIDKGIIIVPENIAHRYKFKHLKTQVSTHPIPSIKSLKAGEEIVNIAQEAGAEDLVLVLISGGGSALVEVLRPQITLDDLIETTKLLLKSGANIEEVNTVRKHLSLFKGGWLAKMIYPAKTVSLIISDVVGDPIEFIASGPTAPDTTTFKNALDILSMYNLVDKVPRNVLDLIVEGAKGLVEETPKPGDEIFKKVFNFIIASNKESLEEAKKYAEKTYGLNALILTSRIRGEARYVGLVIASILEEIFKENIPLKKPALILAGGETTVTVVGKGKGGRNQELVLSAAKTIKGLDGIAFASIGSDGIDGVTDVAGGIADAHTFEKIREKGLSIDEALKNNDSYSIFSEIEDYVYTGPTGTNVNDLMAGVVLK